MNVTHLIHINRNDQITVQIGKELKAIFEMNKAILTNDNIMPKTESWKQPQWSCIGTCISVGNGMLTKVFKRAQLQFSISGNTNKMKIKFKK